MAEASDSSTVPQRGGREASSLPGEASGALVEEALALALWGRQDEALRLLADLPAGLAPAPGSTPGVVEDRQAHSTLWLARSLLARGQPDELAQARALLSTLSAMGGDVAWRAWLELARIERRSGAVPQAAALLGKAVHAFKSRVAEMGAAAEPLGRMLSAEVSALEQDPARRSTRDERLDAPSLLRLVELGRRLAVESDPDEVLRIVLHEAIEVANAARGFVVLTRDDDFEFALAENLDWSEIDQPSFEISRTLVRRAIEERSSVLISLSDASHADPARRSLAEIGVRSAACVPILHATSVLGVLYLDGRDPGHSFRGTAGRLLELFAAQAGAALINARAHRAQARALETAEETIQRHRSESERRVRYAEIVGISPAMQEVFRKLDRIVPTEMPVLVTGETGTGKELIARLIHSRGSRRDREFVATNCAGIADSLLEAELFGHEKGAFTGADRARPGLFEMAHRGTLFLDEVGDMSPRMQSDLLRVVQSGELRRVGGRETVRVDVRMIAATHRDLAKLVQRGEFRQDLYFRLNVLALGLPALRERVEDLPLLVAELLERLVPPGRTVPVLSEAALRRLAAHAWPGNVRELENVLRRLIVLGEDRIEERHFPEDVLPARGRHGRPGTLRRAEEEAIRLALEATDGNKAEAARILGVDRTTLYAKLRRSNLDT